MIDFGFYNSLRAGPDIKAERAYQQNALQYATALDQFAQARTQERMQAIGGIQSYLQNVDDALNQMLPEDLDRIRGEEQELRKGLVSKIKGFGNDPNAFLIAGGQSELNKYSNSVAQLKSVKQAMINRSNLASYYKDLANPEVVPREVQWTENGKTMSGDIQDNIKAFRQGKTPMLDYQGSYKPYKFNPTDYLKVKNDKEQFVSQQYLLDQMLTSGMKPQDAADNLRKILPYVQNEAVPGSTVFPWGKSDPLQQEYLKARIQRLSNSGVSNKFMQERYFFNKNFGAPTSSVSTPVNSAPVNWGSFKGYLDQYRQPTTDQKLKLSGNGIDPKTLNGGDYTVVLPSNGQTIDLKGGTYNFTDVDPHEYILRDENGQNQRMYYKASVEVNPTDLGLGPSHGGFIGMAPLTGGVSPNVIDVFQNRDKLREMGATSAGMFSSKVKVPVLIDITNPGIQGVYDFDEKKDMKSQYLDPISADDLIDDAQNIFNVTDESESDLYQSQYGR